MKNITHPILAATLAVCTIACDLQSPESGDRIDEMEYRDAPSYSGKDLFMGIFFGQGEVAEQLPLMWGDCSKGEKTANIMEMEPEVFLGEIERMMENPNNKALMPILEKAHKEYAAGKITTTGAEQYGVLAQMIDESDPEFFDMLEEVVASGDQPKIRQALHDGRQKIDDIILVDDDPTGVWDAGNGVAVLFVAVAVVAYVVVAIEVFKPGVDQSLVWEELAVNEIAQQFGQ